MCDEHWCFLDLCSCLTSGSIPEATALGSRSVWTLQTEHNLSALLKTFGSSSAEMHLQCGGNVHFQVYEEMKLWLHVSLYSTL